MTWVYSLPAWLAGMVFIGGWSVLAGAGLLMVRRFVAPPDLDHNDVAGPIISTIGVVLAVMLSFMVVTVWQEYDQAAAVVNTEAGEIADLYHEAAALPPATRHAIRNGLKAYVALVVREEWPMMRAGRTSRAARLTITRVVDIVQMFAPATMAQQNAQADALAHGHNILDARRNRIFANSQAVPPLLWSMMIFVAVVTIGASYLFRVQSFSAHMLMAVALAAVIGAIFVMIAELDLPFRGDLQIPPKAYAQDTIVFNTGD
ncbi:MAG TPA: DUF4239 domain-containing protein [Candidatus Baltobacteraceae bacterium]|nr:DUF4239 domain-containing protein [Candidatus Baltobacteraceae bacterium]